MLFVVILLVIAAVTVNLPVNAESVSMTDAQLGHVRANCTTIKNSLNQLHASDALMRVNRGQLYEAISSKLMQRFSNRVTSNQLDSSSLISIDSSYKIALTTFRDDYITYEKALSLAIGTDCQKQTSEFIANIEKASQARLVLHGDVEKLNSLIDEYGVKFTVIKEQVLGINGGVSR